MCPAARVSYEPTGLTPQQQVVRQAISSACPGQVRCAAVTPSPKNGGRRDYMFGNWRAATMLGTTVATRRTCGEGPVGMSLCPAGRWRMR